MSAPSSERRVGLQGTTDATGEATTELECMTVLFVCGQSPWKETLTMPRTKRISVDTVRQAISKKGVDPPHFRQGHFVVVSSTSSVQVALFRFKETAACSKVESKQHGSLPPPIPRHKELKSYTQEPRHLRVGFFYLYNYHQPYSVAQNEVVLSYCLPVSDEPEDVKLSESQKTTEMVAQLKSHFGAECNVITGSGRNSRHFCPFSGGGDILISGCNSAAVLDVEEQEQVVQTMEGSSASSVNTTPPKEGEIRYGAVENKGSQSPKLPSEVTLQLQADMVLLCASILEKMLVSKPEDAASIKCVTCYGVQLGPSCPLKLLKLTINFDGAMQFEELFVLRECALYGAYIDITLDYVVRAITI